MIKWIEAVNDLLVQNDQVTDNQPEECKRHQMEDPFFRFDMFTRHPHSVGKIRSFLDDK